MGILALAELCGTDTVESGSARERHFRIKLKSRGEFTKRTVHADRANRSLDRERVISWLTDELVASPLSLGRQAPACDLLSDMSERAHELARSAQATGADQQRKRIKFKFTREGAVEEFQPLLLSREG